MEKKIIVLSDSHGLETNMIKVFSMHRDADCFIHLGDGAHEFEQLCRKYQVIGYSVRGNCDYPFLCPQAQFPYAVYTLAERKFFMTHGHIYGVKDSREHLINKAKEICPDADFILYGHTHVSENRYIPSESENEKPIYLINPGSISRPRDKEASYALILIKGKDILTNIAKI